MRWLGRYVEEFGDDAEAVSYFVEPVLRGLRRGQQHEQMKQILERKRSILERFAPRALAAAQQEEE